MILFGVDLGLIGGFLVGAASGAVIALGGYLKVLFGPNPEPFDVQKFALTLAIGLVAGGFASYTGVDFDAGLNFLVAGGYTVIIENWLKALFRWLNQKANEG